MSADIIKHAEFEETYDEPSHPIPSLDTLDVNVVKKGGGSDLVIVVALPLRADNHSKTRLLTKLRNYLMFLATPEFQSASGMATPDNTSVVVELHPGSDPDVFELLAAQEEMVRAHGATLRVEMLGAKELGHPVN